MKLGQQSSYRINALSSLDLTLSPSEFCRNCKAIVSSFFWSLLPNISQYLYTLLGDCCLFNNVEYITNEVQEEYKAFYEKLLATQV